MSTVTKWANFGSHLEKRLPSWIFKWPCRQIWQIPQRKPWYQIRRLYHNLHDFFVLRSTFHIWVSFSYLCHWHCSHIHLYPNCHGCFVPNLAEAPVQTIWHTRVHLKIKRTTVVQLCLFSCLKCTPIDSIIYFGSAAKVDINCKEVSATRAMPDDLYSYSNCLGTLWTKHKTKHCQKYKLT